jgi:plasmid maintenance system antidote protein VapI
MYETSAQVIDALRAKLRAHSDSEIARRLGVTTGAVAHWRVGRAAMSPEVAMRAAELLGVEPDLLVLRRLAELEKSEGARRVIQRMADALQRSAKKTGRTVAVAALAIGASLAHVPTPAHAGAPVSASESVYSVKSRRRLAGALQ